MAYLLFLRHGKSEWNELGLWTGHTDISLNDTGRAEARKAAEAIKDIRVDKIYVSDMKRAQETMEEVKKVLGLEAVGHTAHEALKERHYGIYTGKNKWQIKEEIGEEKFTELRRGWDVKIPEGETLKDVHARASAYFDSEIKKDLEAGHNVLIVAHGNSLRALAKHIEGIPDDEIAGLEIGTGEVHCYELDESGKVMNKEIRSANQNTGKV